jgi:hypothetical protein
MRNAVRAVCLVTGLLRLPVAEALERRASPGMRPGEAATFKFSVGPVESGRARMSVGRPLKVDGRTVIAVRGQAETAPWLQLIVRLNDEYHLVLDAASLLPVSVLSVERGFRDRTIDAKLDGRRADLHVTGAGASDRGHSVRLLPRVSRDPLAELFALRAAPLRDGDQLIEDVLDGTALWRLEMTVHRGERIRLDIDGDGSAHRTAIRVDGKLTRIDDAGRSMGQPQRQVSAWLSDDEARVLLRLDADTDLGRCSLELTQYLPPRR